MTTQTTELAQALVRTTASLIAAVFLLENGGGSAAASDEMFKIMLSDYKNAIEESRRVLRGVKI